MTEPEATPDTPAPKPAGLVDLSDLRMMPAWVAGMGAASNHNKYEEREEREPRRDGGRDRREGDRRGGPPPRRDGGGYGGGGGGAPGRDRGPRRDGPPGAGGGPGRDRRDDRGGPRRFGDRDQARPQREWVEMPRDIAVVIEPEDKAAEMLAGHIRSSGHAFSMFDAARLVLAEGDRFHARFTCASERKPGLFVTPADGGLFLSRDEAVQHVLRSAAIETYYTVEDVELEEPKGDFKSIGICGICGELLGPPSHHSFQSSLLRLHRERFSNMSLEDYKRRVRTETNPEIVAQWKEKQRKGQRWLYIKDLAEGAEAPALSSRAEMEAHFRRLHGEDAAVEVRESIILGNTDRSKMTHVLSIMLRQAVENARKHLFEMSQKLGGGFERRGLKLFKRRAGKLFVCRVKPRAIDPGVVFSARVSKIVEVLKGTAGMQLTQLVETIVPSAEQAPEAEAKLPLTDEQVSVIKDIRWLVNEGYVIEYSDGMIFLGVQGEQPQAKAPKAAKAPEAKAEASAESTPAKAETTTEETSAEETVAETPAEVAAEEAPTEEIGAQEPETEVVAEVTPEVIPEVTPEVPLEVEEVTPAPAAEVDVAEETAEVAAEETPKA